MGIDDQAVAGGGDRSASAISPRSCPSLDPASTGCRNAKQRHRVQHDCTCGSVLTPRARSRHLVGDEPGSPEHGACRHDRDSLPKSRDSRFGLSHSSVIIGIVHAAPVRCLPPPGASPAAGEPLARFAIAFGAFWRDAVDPDTAAGNAARWVLARSAESSRMRARWTYQWARSATRTTAATRGAGSWSARKASSPSTPCVTTWPRSPGGTHPRRLENGTWCVHTTGSKNPVASSATRVFGGSGVDSGERHVWDEACPA